MDAGGNLGSAAKDRLYIDLEDPLTTELRSPPASIDPFPS